MNQKKRREKVKIKAKKSKDKKESSKLLWAFMLHSHPESQPTGRERDS